MSDLLRWGSVGFLDKRQPWQRARQHAAELVRDHRGPAVIGAAAALGLAASTYFGLGYLRYEQLATAEQAASLRSERANADLQDALARLRDQLGITNQALNAAQDRIASLTDEAQQQRSTNEQSATAKADRSTQLGRALEQAQRELHLVEAQRVTLLARLSKAEVELAEGLARHAQAQAGLEQWQKKIQQLTADRDKAITERDQLRARVGELEKHSLRQPQQAPRPVAEAPQTAPPAAVAAAPAPSAPMVAQMATVAPAAPQQVAVVMPQSATAPATIAPAIARPAAVAAVSRGGLAQVERVLASAGVDVRHLFAQYGMRTGEGGPFIPVGRGAQPDTMTPEKLAALSNLVKVVPVSAPLGSYDVGSGFGVRGDPINGRASFHTGIDLLAPYMTPVYATAAGTVTFSGYRDDYGKIVEIDHGNGISTRYAHLHRQTVTVGQRIAAHTQIGFLGSTGRATGPHVHYEVLVNGEPQDPAKFLGLAHLVSAAQH